MLTYFRNERKCKNTFRGLYTNFARSLYKTDLVKTLIHRTYEISVCVYFMKKSVTLKNCCSKI